MSGLLAKYPALGRRLSSRPKPPPYIDPSAIMLGVDIDKNPVGLALPVRQEHVLILGSSGSGKSRLLLHLMRQAVRRGEGLLFLDPHGEHGDSVYRNILLEAAQTDTPLHVIDLNAQNTTAFNPLSCPQDTDPSVVAGNVMDALAITWDGESFATKPTIERVLAALLIVLIELKLTLCEAPLLLDRDDARRLRRYAIEHVKDAHTRDELIHIQELSEDGRRRRDFDMEIVGPMNRLARLLRPPVLRQMLGQQQTGIDIRAAMDNGEIILANLSGGSQVYKRDTDLVGRLLVRTVLFEAERRTNARPFNLVLDEAPRFLTSDIPILLAESRKMGISIITAMQWLKQAEAHDDSILAALLNVNTKICFRLRDAADSEMAARALVPLHLEKPIKATIKPTVIGYRRITLASQSTGTSTTEGEGQTEGETTGHSHTIGETVGTGRTSGTSQGVTRGSGRNQAKTRSKGTMQTDSASSSTGTSESAGDVMNWQDPATVPLFSAPPEPFILRRTKGTGTTAGNSSGSAHGNSESEGSTNGTSEYEGVAFGRNASESENESRNSSASHSSSASRSKTLMTTRGTSGSKGDHEALEPILQNLPSAVHGLQDQLYGAGLLLRSLPTAVGYLSYVGESGPVSALFTVPNVKTVKIQDPAFKKLRDFFLPTAPPQPIELPHIEPPNNKAAKTPQSIDKPKRDRGERGW